MTTPPVPQWAVDAAKEHYANIFRCFEADPDAPEQIETVMALARIIAAHAPQGNEDGERLDWLMNWNVTSHPFKTRAAIDAARKKDL